MEWGDQAMDLLIFCSYDARTVIFSGPIENAHSSAS